jgi:hypothetical protein
MVVVQTTEKGEETDFRSSSEVTTLQTILIVGLSVVIVVGIFWFKAI